MKILYFVDSLGLGGIQTLLYNIAYLLKKRDSNIRLDFLVYEEYQTTDLEQSLSKIGCNIYKAPSLSLIGLPHTLSFINEFFSTHCDYEIIHAHCSSKGVIPIYYAKKHGIPVRILHSHSTKFQTHNQIKIFIGNILRYPICCLASHYYACSELSADWFFRAPFMTNHKVEIIKNGVILSKYSFSRQIRDEIRAKYNIEKDDFVFGHVGRFALEKNHKFLIEIFNSYHKRFPHSKLMLVGSGIMLNETRNIVKNKKLEDSVIFVGYTSEPDKYYHAFDIFVMPSLFEGLPFVGIEAQSCSLPCLFSDTVSKEVKVLPSTEFISLNCSPEIWAEKIYQQSKSAVRKDVSKEITEAGYNFELEVDRLYNNYKKLLKEVKARTKNN